MNVASLELCKELYRLSGWYTTNVGTLYYTPHTGQDSVAQLGASSKSIPAYDLGYLLRRLTAPEYDYLNIELLVTDCQVNIECYDKREQFEPIGIYNADTPEDAATRAAIELFKQGVLQKEVV